MAPNDSTWTARLSSSRLAARPSSAGAQPLEAQEGRRARGRFTGRRAKKPKLLAVVTDLCTGCAGAPVCQVYCPVEQCMILQPAGDAFPYARIWVDPIKCVGCRKCVRNGPDGTFLEGCPWDAIIMVPTREWEATHGELPY